MCSLRLPIWIGRNKVLDYMFLNKGFSGRQAFARASKVVPDDQVDEIGLAIAKKMSTIVLVVVWYFKEWVRKVLYPHLAART